MKMLIDLKEKEKENCTYVLITSVPVLYLDHRIISIESESRVRSGATGYG